MDGKLRILMQNENLTASKLSEILEVKPAAVSHILSGRNKPSFDLLCKLVNRFPQINPYWLLGDSEQMYNVKPDTSLQTDVQNGTSEDGGALVNLFDSVEQSARPRAGQTSEPTTKPMTEISHIVGTSSDIERVIVIYADRSFESFTPRK